MMNTIWEKIRKINRQDFMMIITALGLVITTTALIFSFIQLNQSKAQLKELKDQTEITKSIGESISTRYLATFPENIKYITEIIKEAKHSIIALTDVSNYGHFSRFKDYNDYNANLSLRANDGVEVYASVYNEAGWRDYIIPSLKKMDISKLITDKNIEPYWDNLEKRKANIKDTLTISGLINQLIDDEQACFDGLINVCKNTERIYPLQGKLPTYCWIIDERTAIFSFNVILKTEQNDEISNYHYDSQEIFFITSDSKLIEILFRVVNSYSPELLRNYKRIKRENTATNNG